MFNTKLKQLQHGLLAAWLAATPTQSVWAQLPTPAVQATPAPMQRVGVQTDKQTLLTLREAVTMALENNREIEIERLNTQLSEQDLRAAKGFYDPALSNSYFYDRQTMPVASILAGGENGKLRTTDFSGAAKLSQQLPWQGGNVNLSYDQSRTTSQNLFNALNPSKSQQQAQLMSFFVNPPLSMLSGATTPVEAMPEWMQPFTLFNPISHFAIIARGILLKGAGLEVLWPHFAALVGFAVVLVGVSAWRFRKQLG